MKKNLFLIIIVILIPCFACSKKQKTDPAAALKSRPVPVMVTKVVEKNVPFEIKSVGNAEAYSSVAIKTQIGGLIVRQAVRDGQTVSKGDLLCVIDQRPFEIALKDAKAKLDRDIALLEKAQEDMSRYTRLVEKNVVSKEQHDQIATNSKALQATIRQDEAAVERAKLDLEYASVKSPISGKVGSVLLNEGNVIKANDDRTIMNINQIQPIYVSFSVPERYLHDIYQAMADGKPEVTVFAEGDEKIVITGELVATDNAVDKTTGTIKLKGLFANTEHRMMPGQFLRVNLKLSETAGALVVPSKVVQTGINGEFAYVVKSDNTVELRLVKIARILDGQTVIESGLKADETVVTDGHILLTPGRAVEIKEGKSEQTKTQKS